ncbi:hypothetical protein G6F68_021467 [Rhizopus microsporus]|nr:hypothetical protein G6F68_021467 [Rhizopus microsporus]
MNGVEPPPPIEIPDEPIVLRPVEHPYPGTKRARKATSFYTPYNSSKQRKKRPKKGRKGYEDDDNSDVEIDADEDYE